MLKLEGKIDPWACPLACMLVRRLNPLYSLVPERSLSLAALSSYAGVCRKTQTGQGEAWLRKVEVEGRVLLKRAIVLTF